ncbi:hypothetical protein SAMN05444008_1234 [Cnuella takakiae]|uniref:Uncharacterized protein n=1 Tax=Cnuella takakiae TaxID=1302690 RepID=A0A1M5IAG4_9BACT|nr:hypothetical protein [Cnuella takakiae]OLY90776.1 hypothetical protein BUE76_01830 [Cnuella takakiae]SHG25364.1 hypothetical protein SAMN05444008_1234 [Cnuella takakiae]
MQEQTLSKKQQDLDRLQSIITQGCDEHHPDAKLLADLSCLYPWYALKYFAETYDSHSGDVLSYHIRCRQAANVILVGASSNLKKILAFPPRNKAEEEKRDRVLHWLEPILEEQAKWN